MSVTLQSMWSRGTLLWWSITTQTRNGAGQVNFFSNGESWWPPFSWSQSKLKKPFLQQQCSTKSPFLWDFNVMMVIEKHWAFWNITETYNHGQLIWQASSINKAKKISLWVSKFLVTHSEEDGGSLLPQQAQHTWTPAQACSSFGNAALGAWCRLEGSFPDVCSVLEENPQDFSAL